MNYIRFFITTVLYAVLFYGCGKDCSDDTNPDCPNYNPCKNIQKTSANFKVYDYVGFIQLPPTWEWYDTDTVRFGCIIEADFYSVAGGISYEWLIDGNRYSGRRIEFKDGLPKGKNLNIQLIVKNQNAKKSCYPDDDGIDTFKRSIYVLAQGQESRALWGIYRGAYDEYPKDSVDFVIHYDTVKITLPYQNCKNFGFNNSVLNNFNTIFFPLGSWGTGDTSVKCQINTSVILNVNNSTFNMKILKSNTNSEMKMKGRKIKQL